MGRRDREANFEDLAECNNLAPKKSASSWLAPVGAPKTRTCGVDMDSVAVGVTAIRHPSPKSTCVTEIVVGVL